ncbi:MAG: hypothetical protein GDA50_00020 [Alphaproteobacteria bacterium GM202ARS2]|nr:hypothetical protein [Alphaproteobacteria bacterium GM202ARS2]
MTQQEKELSIILPDGNPQGIKLVSYAKRIRGTPLTRCAVISKDSLLKNVRNYKHLNALATPCVYFLLSHWKDGIGGVLDIYVGQAEKFSGRIDEHKKKNYWQNTLIFMLMISL